MWTLLAAQRLHEEASIFRMVTAFIPPHLHHIYIYIKHFHDFLVTPFTQTHIYIAAVRQAIEKFYIQNGESVGR